MVSFSLPLGIIVAIMSVIPNLMTKPCNDNYFVTKRSDVGKRFSVPCLKMYTCDNNHRHNLFLNRYHSIWSFKTFITLTYSISCFRCDLPTLGFRRASLLPRFGHSALSTLLFLLLFRNLYHS